MSSPAAQEFWDRLRLTTQSRIGLGRAGNALPTTRVLEFNAAHAAARDAVHIPLDVAAFAARVATVGLGAPAVVASQASSRSEYLRRPDLGRLPASLDSMPTLDADIGVVLADGLSPRALVDHGIGLLTALAGDAGRALLDRRAGHRHPGPGRARRSRRRAHGRTHADRGDR